MNWRSVFTIDVEDWFHILDDPASPTIDEWGDLESRVERNVGSLLEILDRTGTKATMFWLGWVAERCPELLLACHKAGHEIASHGYAHLLAYEAGPARFREDIVRAKDVIESIVQSPVIGFRAPGFGIKNDCEWVWETIRSAGYLYDSSVFPAVRGHGGMNGASLTPYNHSTRFGMLAEVPIPLAVFAGKRVSLFGGGYLRLAPRPLIRWGIQQLKANNRPLVVYVHPREIDSEQPRLPLKSIRRFKSYVNLQSTAVKIQWLCGRHDFVLMKQLVGEHPDLTVDPDFCTTRPHTPSKSKCIK